jgi:Matrixin
MTLRRLTPLFSLALLLALPASAQAGGRLASATGVKHLSGETLYVDVVVAVPPGQSNRQATDRALAEQGASRPPKKPPRPGGPGGGGTERCFYTGLEWSPPSVIQNYNPASARVDAEGALRNTHSDWSNIANSAFAMSYGGRTPRCPSLVQECPGAQAKDPHNDVAWLPLAGSTLGVTWYTTSDPEADMALNTRFTWKNTCGSSGSGYDVETVLLHENGHVAGLDHVNRSDSVMYPSYQSPRCTLYDYDKRAIASLY